MVICSALCLCSRAQTRVVAHGLLSWQVRQGAQVPFQASRRLTLLLASLKHQQAYDGKGGGWGKESGERASVIKSQKGFNNYGLPIPFLFILSFLFFSYMWLGLKPRMTASLVTPEEPQNRKLSWGALTEVEFPQAKLPLAQVTHVKGSFQLRKPTPRTCISHEAPNTRPTLTTSARRGAGETEQASEAFLASSWPGF